MGRARRHISDAMKTISDIAIIGGGVIGLSLARLLCARGSHVTVFDAGPQIPAATNAAAGMLAPSFEHHDSGGPLANAVYGFGVRALAMWPAFAAALGGETGADVDYRGDGILGLAFTEDEAAALAAQAARVAAMGGAAEMVSGNDARAMEPALSAKIIAAQWSPNDAQVDPRRLLSALRASAAKNGAQMIAGKVVRVETAGAGPVLETEDGARVTAGKVVIAGGAVSGLAPGALVFPVKGDATALGIEEGALTRVVRAPGAYLCPKAGGRLVIGATETRGRDDAIVDDAAVEGLKESAMRAAPFLAHAPERERWTGLRPGTPDGAPILGATGKPGVYVALGHYRNGILEAPASAADMAALLLDGELTAELQTFSPARFTAGGQYG